MNSSNISIVYLVAGLSSRFGGRIKQFAKVGPNNKTLIELSMQQAIESGFTKIIFVVGNLTEAPFKSFFKDSFKNRPILYAKQSFDTSNRDKPWGTADALCSAHSVIDSSFIVCNGDDIYGKKTFKTLIGHLKKSSDDAAIGYKLLSVLPDKGSANRGVFKTDSAGYITDLKEIFSISKSNISSLGLNEDSLCSMNIFALHTSTLQKLRKRVEIFKQLYENDRKKECLLPEEFSQLIKSGEIKMRLYSATEQWFGITNPEDEESIRNALKIEHLQSKNY